MLSQTLPLTTDLTFVAFHLPPPFLPGHEMEALPVGNREFEALALSGNEGPIRT